MTTNLANYPLLAQINAPSDLRNISQDQLTRISNELRSYLLNSVSKSSGHFASGLGTIELTVALHINWPKRPSPYNQTKEWFTPFPLARRK